jgi:hypothetical protein
MNSRSLNILIAIICPVKVPLVSTLLNNTLQFDNYFSINSESSTLSQGISVV